MSGYNAVIDVYCFRMEKNVRYKPWIRKMVLSVPESYFEMFKEIYGKDVDLGNCPVSVYNCLLNQFYGYIIRSVIDATRMASTPNIKCPVFDRSDNEPRLKLEIRVTLEFYLKMAIVAKAYGIKVSDYVLNAICWRAKTNSRYCLEFDSWYSEINGISRKEVQ